MSWMVVFCRSSSRSTMPNSSPSTCPDHPCLDCCITSLLVDGGFAEMVFQLGDLRQALHVATALERGGQPQLHDLVSQPEGHHPTAHRQDVGVVVLARQAGGVQ